MRATKLFKYLSWAKYSNASQVIIWLGKYQKDLAASVWMHDTLCATIGRTVTDASGPLKDELVEEFRLYDPTDAHYWR